MSCFNIQHFVYVSYFDGDRASAVVPSLGSPDALGLKLPEAFTLAVLAKISGNCSSRIIGDPGLGANRLVASKKDKLFVKMTSMLVLPLLQ